MAFTELAGGGMVAVVVAAVCFAAIFITLFEGTRDGR